MASAAASADFRERPDCRVCGNRDLLPTLDLGLHPPSNAFLAPADAAAEARFPLRVVLCARCGLSQLSGVVDARRIFDDYSYVSSTSKALVRHYAALCADLRGRFGLKAGDAVLDVGCNDGILLSAYQDPSLRRLGVEPSQLAEAAARAGHTVYREYFTAALARRIRSEQGPVRVVTATNVFAHIDDIHDVAAGVAALLADDGAFVIETPYTPDTVAGTYFDTVYHEHLCYWSLAPLARLGADHGLELVDAERVPFGASGPAVRVVFRPRAGAPARTPRAAALFAEEEAWGLRSAAPYAAFAERVRRVGTDLRALLDGLRAKGARLGAYGAPAKGNTLLNAFGIGPDRITEGVAESNALKVGKLTPGSHLPIVSEEEFLRRRPDYALLLTWNYLDFFLAESPYIRAGGRFVVPLPVPAVRPEA